MLQFECYPTNENQIFLKIKTDHTEEGTLYRLSAALFFLGMDIIKGEIKTIIDEVKKQTYSEDIFILRAINQNFSFNEFTYQLGILMDALLDRNQDPEELLLNLKIHREKIPTLKEFIEAGFEYVIDEIPGKKQIYFYFETSDRPGLLLAISKFFFEQKINVINAEIETERQIAKDIFYLQFKEPSTKKILKDEIENLLKV